MATKRKPHARVSPDVKRAIVFKIAERMAVGEWCTGEMLDLCDEFNVSQSVMGVNAAEASRLLEYTTQDRTRLKALVQVRLNQISAENGNDRVRANEILLKTIGALEDRGRIQLDTASMSPEQLEKELESLLLNPGPALSAALERYGWHRSDDWLELARGQARRALPRASNRE